MPLLNSQKKLGSKPFHPFNSINKSHTLLFSLIFLLLGTIVLIKSFASNPNLPGDLNNDNIVNISDLSILLSSYGTNNANADINSDGIVGINDLSILLSNYRKTFSTGSLIFNGTFTAGMSISTLLWPMQSWVGSDVTAVHDPLGSTVDVAKYSVTDGDSPYGGYHSRADMMTQSPTSTCDPGGAQTKGCYYKNGTTTWTSIPVYVPDTAPLGGSSPILGQNNGTSFYQIFESKDIASAHASWAMNLIGINGQMSVNSDIWNIWNGPAIGGGWHTAVIETYNTTSSSGWLQLWWDSVPQVLSGNGTFTKGTDTNGNPQTLTGNYRVSGFPTINDASAGWPLDINSYRAPGHWPGTTVLYHGPVKIGNSYSIVQPSSSPSGP
jgi:hypothetical protein